MNNDHNSTPADSQKKSTPSDNQQSSTPADNQKKSPLGVRTTVRCGDRLFDSQ